MTALTTRLGGLFRKMKTSKPVRVVIGDSDRAAKSLERMVEEPRRPEPPTRKGLLSRLPGSRRDEAISQLQDGFNEVVGLIHHVRSHLDEQADRSERLLEKLENLPHALESLSETSRNQARMVEAMNTHFTKAERQSASLNEALGGLARSGEHQGQVMGLMQRTIESAGQRDEQMLGSFGAINETLQQLSQSNHASARSLATVTEHARTADERIDGLIRRNSRHMIAVSVTGWVLGGSALVLAIYALLALG